MEEKSEKEIKRFPYERPGLVNLSTSDFALYQGAATQCNSGSGATTDCTTGFIAVGACTQGASVV